MLMKTLKIIGFAVLGLITTALIWTMTLPSEGSFARSTTIKAPPETVFAELNSFQRFNQWSPWFKIDSNTQYKY